jgi:hypothetical protein
MRLLGKSAVKYLPILCGLIAMSVAGAAAQGVQGVGFQTNSEAYVGYTYLRFYALPTLTENTNGFNASIAYYPRDHWYGLDGEIAATFASESGGSSSLFLGMGGGRIRHRALRGTEVWVHGLAGGGHSTPKMPYGGEGAFAFEGGGGIDIGAHNRRLAYRIEADVVGTRFFDVFQYSPKVSVGIVFRF